MVTSSGATTLRAAAILAVICGWCGGALAQTTSGPTLDVMTFNVWHGLRSGESRKRFPGEDAARAARRFAWQVEEIERLDPDVLLFQEVNPNQSLSRRFAEALGYDEIHKVTSCGVHLGTLLKIPRNMNEGIAILAKPELGLERVGTKRLSGNARCTATWGFQTRESRYVLLGRISVEGRTVLLATTHLASPSFTPDDFDERLARMVETGALTAAQQVEILADRDRKLDRNTTEAERLVSEIARHRDRLARDHHRPMVIFGGDFNAEPDRPSIDAVRAAGYIEAGAGTEMLTWDPIANEENYRIGTRRHYSLPTFDKPEIEAMLDERHDMARQIDHLFVSAGVEVVSAEMVMTTAKDGIYPSDHFAILARVRLP